MRIYSIYGLILQTLGHTSHREGLIFLSDWRQKEFVMVLLGRTRTRFSVQADYEASTLSRVLELFSVRGLACDNLSARRTDGGLQWIEVDCSDVEDQHTSVLLNKLRQIITVRSVRVETMVLAA
jgi:acetolactate synthase regulatory subunit